MSSIVRHKFGTLIPIFFSNLACSTCKIPRSNGVLLQIAISIKHPSLINYFFFFWSYKWFSLTWQLVIVNWWIKRRRLLENWVHILEVCLVQQDDCDFTFSNSLIIHEEKTKEITTVKEEVWICDPKYHRIRRSFAFFFSKSYQCFEKLYQTLERVFHQISKNFEVG